MSQVRVGSATDIYNKLLGDIEFMSSVGQYTFTSGTNAYAISVVTPSNAIPDISNVTGVEVIIHDTGVPSRTDYLTNQSDILLTYSVFLVLWQPETGFALNAASTRLMEIFAGAKLIQTVPQTDNKNILIQNLIQIPNNAAIMLP